MQEPINKVRKEIYLQHIKAKDAILVDIGMEAECVKFDTLRFEGIVCRELQCQLVGQSLIDSCRLPLMVPIHAKMLSPSGNAEIPGTPHVWKDHTVHCLRKLGTFATRQ
jgi:hypothetical protein